MQIPKINKNLSVVNTKILEDLLGPAGTFETNPKFKHVICVSTGMHLLILTQSHCQISQRYTLKSKYVSDRATFISCEFTVMLQTTVMAEPKLLLPEKSTTIKQY